MKTDDWREHGNLTTYVLGLGLCLLLTGMAYFAVVKRVLSPSGLIATVVALGFIQTVVQLVLFLHLGAESRPKWHFIVFLFMVLVLLILVVGSLWIMWNLDYRMMNE